MPRFDGTGPYGLGPETGRGRGRCNRNDIERRNDIAQHLTPKEQLEYLKASKKKIELEISALEKRHLKHG